MFPSASCCFLLLEECCLVLTASCWVCVWMCPYVCMCVYVRCHHWATSLRFRHSSHYSSTIGTLAPGNTTRISSIEKKLVVYMPLHLAAPCASTLTLSLSLSPNHNFAVIICSRYRLTTACLRRKITHVAVMYCYVLRMRGGARWCGCTFTRSLLGEPEDCFACCLEWRTD